MTSAARHKLEQEKEARPLWALLEALGDAIREERSQDEGWTLDGSEGSGSSLEEAEEVGYLDLVDAAVLAAQEGA